MLRAALLSLALSIPLSACGAGGSQGDDEPRVVAAFYPLAWVAEQVVGDHAEVENLTAGGQEPHDLELSVRQTASVASATAAFYTAGFQPAVDEAVAQSDGVVAVDAAKIVGLEEAEHEEHDGEHGDEHEHEEEGHEEDEHDHAHSEGSDPHFWLDPTLLAKAADGFAEAMAEADPDHAAAYRSNAAQLDQELATLDEDIRNGLRTCRTRAVVVSHDAFSYLGRRYDLHLVPIAGLSPDAEPSARQLAQIRAEAQDAGVTTVFSERLASPAMAKTLAGELGVEVGVLDPLEGLDKGASGDYLSIMRENLQALRTANGCT